jgi:putative endonuclease
MPWRRRPPRPRAPWNARAQRSAMSDAWVYMLRCADGSLYTGWSSDLERRLARHRAGTASRYTASRLPVELAMAAAMPDRGAAMREEARIKRLDRGSKLALIEAVGTSAAEGGSGVGGVRAPVES